jgi:two-component sensor histidine kinase
MIVQTLGDRDQQVLIQEFHHRLANEFQVMTSIVGRAKRAGARERRVLLNDLEERIQAFSALNRLLADPQDVGTFDDYCRLLCGLLIKAFGRGDVAAELDFSEVPLPPNDRLYIALIVVELIMNALKHGGARGRGETIRVWLRVMRNRLELSVTNQDPDASGCPSLVPRMVETLAQQLTGSVRVSHEGGYEVNVRLPIKSTPLTPSRTSVRLVSDVGANAHEDHAGQREASDAAASSVPFACSAEL